MDRHGQNSDSKCFSAGQILLCFHLFPCFSMFFPSFSMFFHVFPCFFHLFPCFSMCFPSIPTGILYGFVWQWCLNGCEIPSQWLSVQPSIWTHRQPASGLLNPGISTCLKLSQCCRLIFNRSTILLFDDTDSHPWKSDMCRKETISR